MKLGASAGHNLTASYTFSGVSGAQLKGHEVGELQGKLKDLKKSNHAQWEQLKHKWTVTQTFYATQVEITFQKGGNVLAEADVKKITSVDISANVKSDWSSGTKLVITGDGKVPFAFRGFQVNP